jgi:hypothetical protein
MSDYAVLVQVADGVVAMLKDRLLDGTFSQQFSPRRSYADWDLALETIDQALLCDVVPVNNPKSKLADRGGIEYTVQIDIVFRRKFVQVNENEVGRIDNEVIDPCVKVVEELLELFCAATLEPREPYQDLTVIWESAEVLAAYKKDHLRKNGQFTGVVRLTFTVTKNKE